MIIPGEMGKKKVSTHEPRSKHDIRMWYGHPWKSLLWAHTCAHRNRWITIPQYGQYTTPVLTMALFFWFQHQRHISIISITCRDTDCGYSSDIAGSQGCSKGNNCDTLRLHELCPTPQEAPAWLCPALRGCEHIWGGECHT